MAIIGVLGSGDFSNFANTTTGIADKFSANVTAGLPTGAGFGGGGFTNLHLFLSGQYLQIEAGIDRILAEDGSFIITE